MSEITLIEALERINKEIFEMNNHNTTSEDYYWWNAVLETFGYYVDKEGCITKSDTDRN